VDLTTTPLPTSIQEILDDAVSKGIDGISVYVDQVNKIDQKYAAGIQNKVTKSPADTISLFKIASISKLYIAISTVKLAVQTTIIIKLYFSDAVT
jgi:D-alanyl-D-alanine carboxypeptidase